MPDSKEITTDALLKVCTSRLKKTRASRDALDKTMRGITASANRLETDTTLNDYNEDLITLTSEIKTLEWVIDFVDEQETVAP